jgi:hypothetical protein
MTRSPRPPRTPANLSESVHRLLNMYTLAASGAGISLLAFVQPAEARIVYTKVHQVIGPGGSYKLDLNQDGITDFKILEVKSATNQQSSNCLCVYTPHLRDGIMAYVTAYRGVFAFALQPGVSIDGKDYFKRRGRNGAGMIRTQQFTEVQGQWVNVTDRYLGLRFFIHGKVHYGWARLSVKVIGTYNDRAVLTGYAYETIPNKAIVTGKTNGTDDGVENLVTPPATLGRLALGRQ